MSRRFRSRLVGVAIVSACGFTAVAPRGDGGDGTAPDDSRIIDSPPDVYIAPECLAAVKSCVGSGERLRECTGVGATPIDTICAWRCTDDPAPHCRKLQPAGGAVSSGDLEPTTGLADKTIMPTVSTVDFNTTTGSIVTDGVVTVRSGTAGIVNGIEFSVRNGVGVWRFNKLNLSGFNIRFTGANAAALVAVTEIEITGKIDLQGDCQIRKAGPGGGSGGDDGNDGSGSGNGSGGTGSDADCNGGGGGGHAAAGGSGGGGTSGGTEFGTPTILTLRGGGGGGGGGGNAGGDGGGGGGAIQIVANLKVRFNGSFTSVGGIQAGGCAGATGAACGGGAGAGGTILIEAAVIEVLDATFAVNGGGGGGGKNGTNGERARFSTSRANGGAGGTGGSGDDGGDGGDGGDDNAFPGLPGSNATLAGGGGGAVGRIRFHTLSGTIMKQGVIFSPPLPSTPVTEGSAILQ